MGIETWSVNVEKVRGTTCHVVDVLFHQEWTSGNYCDVVLKSTVSLKKRAGCLHRLIVLEGHLTLTM